MIQLTLDNFLPEDLYNKIGRLFEIQQEADQYELGYYEFNRSSFFYVDQREIACSSQCQEAQDILFEYAEFLQPMAKKFISNADFAEYWYKDGDTVQWHIDKDERIHTLEKRTVPTNLSTIFYYKIEDLPPREGRLRIIDEKYEKTKRWRRAEEDPMWLSRGEHQMHVRPVSNRLVIFSPLLYHCSEPIDERYAYERKVVLVNFWDHKLCT